LIGGIATEIERESDTDEIRLRLISSVLLSFLKRADGLRLIASIKMAFHNAPSPRGNEWIGVIDFIMSRLYADPDE
jgi:hypothetical protein